MKTEEYIVELDSYSGPLDLLLRLIEAKQLDICDISLSQVTDEYINSIPALNSSNLEAHNWFLDIAVRLILMKSRALIPQTEPEEDRDSIEDLTAQLMELSKYQKLGKQLAVKMKSPHKVRKTKQFISKGPFENLDIMSITNSYQNAIKRSNENIPTTKQPIRLKRQSIRSLQLILLNQWKKDKKLNIAEISTNQPNKQYSVALFSLVLEYIHSDKAVLLAKNENLYVELR